MSEQGSARAHSIEGGGGISISDSKTFSLGTGFVIAPYSRTTIQQSIITVSATIPFKADVEVTGDLNGLRIGEGIWGTNFLKHLMKTRRYDEGLKDKGSSAKFETSGIFEGKFYETIGDIKVKETRLKK